MLGLYQCLLHCCPSKSEEGTILVAASGPYLHSFNLKDGHHLFTWSPGQASDRIETAETSHDVDGSGDDLKHANDEDIGSPQKRQKLSISRLESGSSTEIIVDNLPQKAAHLKSVSASSSIIIKLTATSTGQHVVAATSEDKAVRVYDLSADGVLTLLSERRGSNGGFSFPKVDCNRLMPKRPCSIVMTSDDSTILCADKFGDVYALPLIQSPLENTSTESASQEIDPKWTKSLPKNFAPSATTLTVHTKGNREALRQQQKLKAKKSEKKLQHARHKLLLGHVSLLTDIVCAKSSLSASGSREYILTCDRDEHIRVSRGVPQAHIVENYCLGHTEFISKLCIVPKHEHLLISGGGDDYLLLWDWLSGAIKQRMELKSHVERIKVEYQNLARKRSEESVGEAEATVDENRSEFSIAVSKIIVLENAQDGAPFAPFQIAATCEG